MELLCPLLGAVCAVTLVGHGLWLIFARLLRSLAQGEEPLRPVPAATDELHDLTVTSRIARRLAAQGDLDEEAAERLLQAVALRQEALRPPRKPVRVGPTVSRAHPTPVREEDVPELELVPEGPQPPVLAVVPEALPPQVAAAPPRRSWSDLLAGFMEARNILWGELVGGLLIVGCSAALVVTLWQTLEDIPYFPFLVLSGISLALFGIGHYTLHHWKLASTSRGLLAIATLLVPLNLLVLAGLSRGREGGLLETATTALGLAVFTFAVAGAGRVLAPGSRWLLALGVVGAAASQLLAPRLPEPTAWLFVLPAWLTVGCHCTAMGGRLRQLRREGPLTSADVHPLLLFLGAVAFAAAVALGFLLSRAGDLRQALQYLALPLAVAGVPILSAGLLLQRRLSAAPPSEEDARSLGGLRATATAIALAGTLVLLGSLALAWPNPVLLLCVCLVDGGVLTALAFRYRMPFVHAAALPCLVLGLLSSLHLSVQEITAPELFAPDGGAALALLVVLLAVAAEGLSRGRRHGPALVYALASAATATLSLLLVSLGGVEQPGRTALVAGLYTVTALLANVRWQRPAVSYLGQLLVLFATLWGLRWLSPELSAAWGVTLALEALGLAAVAAWRGHWGLIDGVGETSPESPYAPRHRVLTLPCHNVSWVAAGLAILLALAAPDFPTASGHAATAFALAATMVLLAWVSGVSAVTFVAAGFLWAGLAHLLVWDLSEEMLPRPWLASLLVCSGLLMLVRLILGRFSSAARVYALFAVPLGRAALVGSLLALPVMLATAWGEMAALAGYTCWVALLWLAFACAERSPGWLSAFQAALSAAVLLASAAWVEQQPWGSVPVDLADLGTLYALGIGLGLLGLVWVLLRLGLRTVEAAQSLLVPPWPAWDRLVLVGLVLGQLGLAAWSVWPGVMRELAEAGDPVAAAAPGTGAWLLLSVLALVLVISLWDRAVLAAFGLMLLALTVPLLAAGPWDSQRATATALNWGLGLALLLCSAPLWLRLPLRRWAERSGIVTRTELPVAQLLRLLVVAASVAPVVLLAAVVVLLRLAGLSTTPPAAAAVVPLAFVGLGLLGYALRERLPSYAFAAGWTVNLAAALIVCRVHGSDVEGLWISFLQANVLASAAVALLWLLAEGRSRLWQSWPPIKYLLLGIQSLLGLSAATLLLLGPLALLFAEPAQSLASFVRVGQPLGWLAWLLASAAALGFAARRWPRLFVSLLGVSGLCLGMLAALTAERWSDSSWLGYHVLTACWAALGAGAALLSVLGKGRLWSAISLGRWTEGLGLALVVLGMRGGWSDPLRPFTSAGPVLLAALMAGTLALRWRRPEQVYLSGTLFTLAGVLAWVAWGPTTLDSFTLTVSLSLAAAGMVWTLADLWLVTDLYATREDAFSLPFPYVATAAALALLSAVVLTGVAAILTGESFRTAGELVWAAIVLTALALAVTLWDARARPGPAGLFVTGLLASAVFLQGLPLTAEAFGRLASLALAAYVLLTAALVASLPFLAGLWQWLRLPSHLYEQPPRSWFRATQAVLAGLVVGLTVWVSLSFDTPGGRLAGPAAVALLLAAALLPARAPAAWVEGVRLAVLALGVLFCVEGGWALLASASDGLHHSVVCLAVFTVLALVYGDGLRWLPSANVWRDCGRRVAALLGGLAMLALLLLLGQEFALYDKASRHTPLTGAEVALVTLAVLTLIYLAIRSAVSAPSGQTDGWRTLYVYGAELLLVLLFVHVKLNVPALFGTWGAKYWTLFVMALAYVGVGLSEFFHRRGLTVLAGPLQRTGLFLPLLPLLVFWLRPPAALLAGVENAAPGAGPLLLYLHKLPWAFHTHALLWFMLSLLYALVAVSRRSLRLALLAALAANFGLWSLLAHFEVAFLLHPQVWLIPLALVVLVSEHLNRDRLTREQSLALRYAGLSMVYVSSTADLFLAGLGNSAALPVVLALLSVLGVLGGILLRVRAFLFMGLTFLALDVFAMIWHAAVDRTQTWIWYVSGIVLGSAILALFAVFEKRRNDVLHLLDKIRRWD